MIKINLLPTKRKVAKKVTELQQQMVLGGLIVVLVAIGMGYFWRSLNNRIEALEQEKTTAEAKIQAQENMLKEVKNVEEERKKVFEKIEVIEQLKKNQTGPVRLLDEVSKSLPGGVNLTSLSEKSGQVDIEGTAFTNNDIVRFIDNLKTQSYFSDIFLMESKQATIEGVDMYKYKLQFNFRGV
jgi:type IV pilus assembly protein PilN